MEELVVTLTAKVDGYVKSFQQAQVQTVETTRHIQDATEKVKGFTDSVTSFGQATLAGIAGIGAARWFKEVFDLAGSAEQQFLGLSAAVRANTDDVDNTIAAYKRFSEGMFEVTGTSKRTTLALLQMDEMQGLTAKRAMETARQAIALGAATGMDPRSLISRINMAQTGSGIEMLRRVPGIRGMTDESAMVDKANRLMAIGMDVSKAQMQSAAGMVKKLSEELEEVKKQFGKLLLEALKPGIELLTKTVQWFKDLDERTKLVILSLAGMTAGVVALVNGIKLLNAAASALFSGTGGLLAIMLPLAVAAALWAEHLGGVSKAWDLVKAKAQQFWDYISPVVQGVWDAIRIGAMVMANAVVSAWEVILAAWRPIKDLILEGWEELSIVASQVAEELGSIWEPLEVAAAAYVATLAVIGTALYVAIPKSLEELLPIGLRVFPLLAGYAREALASVMVAVEDAVAEATRAVSAAGSAAGSVLASIGEWFSNLPSKIQRATSWIADLIEKLPAIIHEAAKDMVELVSVVEGLARAFRWVNDLVGQLPKGTAILAGVLGVAVALSTGLYQIGFMVAGIATGFGVLGDKFLPVAAAFMAWLAWAGPKMSAIVGVITLLAARTDLVWQALAKVKELFNWIVGSNEGIKNLADKVAGFFRWIGAAIGPAVEAIGGFFSSMWQSAVEAFDLVKGAVSEAFGVVKEVAGGVFEVISEAVANFNWNLQNTIMVVAAAVGIIAAMTTFLLVWATAAKVVLLVMTLLTTVLGLNKLAWFGLSLLLGAGNALLVLTGLKILAVAAATVIANLATVLWTMAKGAFTVATLASIVALSALLVIILAVAAAVIGIVVVAFVAAASAVMSLVEALKVMTMFSGAADAFRHWKGILGGLVTAIQVDMGLAWRHVQDAMHLAGEEVKAFWPPVWERIKEGFLLLWDLVVNKFKASMARALIEFQDNSAFFKTTDEDRAYLKEKEDLAKDAINRLNEYSKRPLDLSKITSPGMEKALEIAEMNLANANELAKLKKAADEEADKAAKKHKEELDTATRLNNLAQQHNELKRAELVLANSADALYKIQAYRTAMQASLEARAAQMRKDALDKEPEKGPAQLALEVGLAAAKRNEDVVSAVAKSQVESAKTDKEAALIAAQWAAKVGEEYSKALDGAKTLDDTIRVMERFGKVSTEAELARSRTAEKAAHTAVASSTSDAEKRMLEAEAKLKTIDRQFGEALALAKGGEEIWAVRDKFKSTLDAALAEDVRASKEYIDSLFTAGGKVPSQEPGKDGGWGDITALLREIRDNSSWWTKKPSLEVMPVGLK